MAFYIVGNEIMRMLAGVVAAIALAGLPSIASAKVRITVDLDGQTMHVESKDHVFDWKISSGKDGYETPPGTYRVLWTDKNHFSEEYDGAPMPNAIFFKPGFAIHGAYKSDFGHPASHGCIRLPVAKSAILFNLVKTEGAEIDITGGEVPTTVEPTIPYTGASAGFDEPDGYVDAPAYRERRAPARERGRPTAFDPLDPQY